MKRVFYSYGISLASHVFVISVLLHLIAVYLNYMLTIGSDRTEEKHDAYSYLSHNFNVI